MENQNLGLLPSYGQLLEEMGRQLNKRKLLLAKRIFLVVWPYLLLVIVGYIFNRFYDIEAIVSANSLLFFVCFGLYLLLAGIYSIIMRFILTIEKQIWVDSYFDNKNLEPKDSWRIARKLFWPGFKFRLRILIRFFFVPILVSLVVIIVIAYVSYQFINDSKLLPSVFISIVFLFAIGFLIYSYYLKVKLRYSWFIFLDNFGKSYTFEMVMTDLNKLNEVSKTETFKKSLIVNLGTDTVKGIALLAVRNISRGISALGSTGQLFGSLFRIYGEEMTRQVTDLANISAQYMMYRFARKAAYGEEQSVNESVYGL